jgi:hypothetical protein
MMQIDPNWQPVFRELGIDADAVFDHPLIKPWRTVDGRENCLLDATLQDGRQVRLHIKRYDSSVGARNDVAGIQLLNRHEIPTVQLVAWGALDEKKSFVITNDLAGYKDAEKMLAAGEASFDQLLEPTARLAAKLHRARLHHRDLYLCHFFARVDNPNDVKLIDVSRVKELPRFFSRRWIVKDLAQFWYSTMPLPVSDEQRAGWLEEYLRRKEADMASLKHSVERKAAWIARHDRSLKQRRPARNISIPESAR